MKFAGASSAALPAAGTRSTARRRAKPPWLRVRAPGGESYAHLRRVLRQRNLHTVCEEARCPNLGECWGGGTATFMVLGDLCTRGCRFCAVRSGNPAGRVDPDEPERLADAVSAMGLDYVVLTMVNRDDLADDGARHVAQCIGAIKRRDANVLVEALVGDFRGRHECVDVVCEARPDVFAHNLETVERLQPVLRDRRAGYQRSLAVLARAKRRPQAPYTKSSLMLGVGERATEVIAAMADLRREGVDFLTLGQYLRPTPRHLRVEEYLAPERFDDYRRRGEGLGFRYVAAGPLVRSSYRAGEFFVSNLVRSNSVRA